MRSVNVSYLRHLLAPSEGSLGDGIYRPDWRLDLVHDDRFEATKDVAWSFSYFGPGGPVAKEHLYLQDDEVIGFLVGRGLMTRDEVVEALKETLRERQRWQFEAVFGRE